MEVLAPVPDRPTPAHTDADAEYSFEGKTVALVENGWLFLGLMYDQIERRLREDYGVKDVVRGSVPMSTRAPSGTYDAIAASADVAIVGCAT